MSVLGMKVIDIPESEVSFLIESERRKFTLSTNKASSKLIWVQHLKNTAEEVILFYLFYFFNIDKNKKK